MVVTFSDLHTEAGLKSLEAFLSGKTYISGDQITKDDVKVYAAVLIKPSADLYPSASQWYECVASKLASSFPGKAAGVGISSQAPSTKAAPVKRSYGYSYDGQSFDPYWAHRGSMSEVVEHARPSAYQSWDSAARALFDHLTMIGASQERAAREHYFRQELAEKQRYARQEHWNKTHAYALQLEVNYRYEDDRPRRMHYAWHAGQPVVSDPPYVDYTTLPPYDGSKSYPVPAVHHSMWLRPRQAQTPPQ